LVHPYPICQTLLLCGDLTIQPPGGITFHGNQKTKSEWQRIVRRLPIFSIPSYPAWYSKRYGAACFFFISARIEKRRPYFFS
jgi:hypothetical protein